MALLEVNNLVTKFKTDAGDVQAVRGVSFKLEPKEALGIVGESGSGKSQMMYSIIGLLAETAKSNPAMSRLTESIFRRRISKPREIMTISCARSAAIPWR